MKNYKLTIACAATGLVLSFVVGLFSRISFGTIILRSFIFAIIFAVLAVALQFLFSTVFSSSSVVDSSDSSESVSGKKMTGSIVDITLPDEELPQEMGASNFYVGTNHPMLNESDYSMQSVETDVFKSNQSNTENSSGLNSAGNSSEISEISSEEKSQSGVTESENNFSRSPITSVAQSDNQSYASALPNFSDINDGASSTGDISNFSKKNNDAEFNSKDSVLMARTISTLLSKEN